MPIDHIFALISLGIGVLSAVVAVVSAWASITSAAAAKKSAENSETALRQATAQQRIALERETSRSIDLVFAGASRVIELANQLERSYQSQFRLNGRNVDAAKPLVDRVEVKRAQAQVAIECARECNKEQLAEAPDSELEDRYRSVQGHLAHLAKLEEGLALDLGRSEEQIRDAVDRNSRRPIGG